VRIAVIGAGVSGLVTAYLLADEHEVTVFEANDYIGGHTHTVDTEAGGRTFAVDTGFIVFNERTYPNFVRLLKRLGVAWQPSNMSFGVRCEKTGLEYSPSSLNSFFAQRRNLLKPSFYRLIADVFRFRRESQAVLAGDDWATTLTEFLAARGYSRRFVEQFLVPMGAAIWSAAPEDFGAMPVRFFAQFFHNHGFLNVRDQPQWLTLRGGSRSYIAPLTAAYSDRIRLSCPVESVRRRTDCVEVTPCGGAPERFDQVVIATHSDQALRLLADPSPAEREILGAIPYQENDTVLHTDASLLPRCRRAWASWNYLIPREARRRVCERRLKSAAGGGRSGTGRSKSAAPFGLSELQTGQ